MSLEDLESWKTAASAQLAEAAEQLKTLTAKLSDGVTLSSSQIEKITALEAKVTELQADLAKAQKAVKQERNHRKAAAPPPPNPDDPPPAPPGPSGDGRKGRFHTKGLKFE